MAVLGRTREVAALLRAVTDASAGSGSARILLGEEGIGRSTVLRHLADTVSCRVLWVRGCRAEAELPFAGAAQLLGGLGEHFAQVPPARRRALEVALALADGPAPNVLAVCAGALDVLGAAAKRGPLLVLVDDLQWIDPESRLLLAYVGRRLARERIALVMALREMPADPEPELPVVALRGLNVADSRRLARSHGLTAHDHEVAAAVEATGGNPLALLEMLTGASKRTVWHDVLAELPEATRRALLVLAVAGPLEPASLDATLAELELSLHDLDPAERLDLVTVGDQFRLRHPLLGAALTAVTPTATKRAVHRALAATSEPDRQAWYQSMVTAGPDDELATRLAGIARRAGERADHEAAARFMHRAADLTGALPAKAERLLSAAASAMRDGAGERAVSWCRHAIAIRADPGLLPAATVISGRALAVAGRHREAYDTLTDAASRVARHDPVAAAVLLCEATVPATVLGQGRLACEAAGEAESLAGGAPLPARARLQATAARVLHGLPDKAAWPDGEAALPSVDELAGDTMSLVQAATVHLWAERPEAARMAVNAAIDRLRRGGSQSLLAVALTVRSDLAFRAGRWMSAQADAMEAVKAAESNGTVAFGLIALARLDAVRGDDTLCGERIARSRREAGPYGIDLRLLLEPAVEGLAALGAGEPAAALEPLEAAWAQALEGGVGNPNVVPFAADLAEANVRCGHRKRATEVLSWLEERAATLRLAGPLRGALRGKGLLDADVELLAAARQACDNPFELARILLCEGEVLRRTRHPAAARPSLRKALRLFEGLGAKGWAERVATELAAAGERDVTAPDRTVEVLTPQQLQIARLVAAGRNNVETAEALFLSRKTVEGHLTQVYRKLRVHSRTQLVNALSRLDNTLGGAGAVFEGHHVDIGP
ncbi:LuxR family transcriptional regulator [Kutzneria buriramensis]|uniref:Regulatory LuxR family protein n=1 Tax=Kutzneria buriramensis TaxID=1045776 RepID=A0A3E0HI84_9PSEU|nr:LuxR family transcriptional regulator [Kutzneria buriramensis]REH45916.1 regulatory LuxR family protein [Kutzneria buriramensis]